MNVSAASLASNLVTPQVAATSTATPQAPATSTTGAATPTSAAPTGAATSAATSSPAGGLGGIGGQVSQTQFLQLLVAQLKNQDPLQPQDSTAFVAQLAQFATLEQSTITNDKLSTIAAGQSSDQRANMTNLVGHTLTARADTLTLAPQNGAAPSLLVHLPGAAASVQVTVTDGTGRAVRTINMGPQAAGDLDTAWLGTDDHGAALPAGTYKVAVKALGAAKNDLGGVAEVRGQVSSLEFNGGSTLFRVGSATVNPGDIVSISN